MKIYDLFATLAISALWTFSTLASAGQWVARQDNGFDVSFNVTQKGTTLTGNASHSNGAVTGYITEGSVINNFIALTVNWNNNTKGRYTGHIDPGGKVVDGFTFDLNNKKSTAKWHSITPVNLAGGGTANASPGKRYCAADCNVCARDGLRCTNGGNCQQNYPTTSPWLCY